MPASEPGRARTLRTPELAIHVDVVVCVRPERFGALVEKALGHLLSFAFVQRVARRVGAMKEPS
jgi:hypothetical protein